MGDLYISLIDHSILQGCIYALMPKELLNLFEGHVFINVNGYLADLVTALVVIQIAAQIFRCDLFHRC